jgi:hypothetical protein
MAEREGSEAGSRHFWRGRGSGAVEAAARGDRGHQAADLLISLGRWGPASKRSVLARRNEGRMRWRIDISSKTERRQSGFLLTEVAGLFYTQRLI